MAMQSYDGMHLIYEALKKTKGSTDGGAIVAAMKGMSWISPAWYRSLIWRRANPEHLYPQGPERVNGELYNVELRLSPP